MYVRVKTTEGREYLQIVESQREGKRIKQKLVASLGRLDKLRENGNIDRILISLQKFSENLSVLGEHKKGNLPPVSTRKIGPPLLFGKIWKKIGLPEIMKFILDGRKFEFPLEKAVFLTVVHRLMVSGSDRAADRWKEEYAFDEDVQDLQLHHLYWAMAWLGEPLPVGEQTGATPFSPRCTKDRIEELLFKRTRDLFSEFDLVFFDTTSIYFEGNGGDTLGENGHSKDHRPDLKQMVVGVVLDSDGRPVCSEMWPGNTTDVTTLIPVVDRLSRRFGIRRICIVADRGMISVKTLDELEKPERHMDYILGARMRISNEVREEVLGRPGRFKEVQPERRKAKDPSPLKVKEVWVEDRRYIVCHNEEQARKDRGDREAILSSLREALKRGDKSLVGNKGYRRFLKTSKNRESFAIDEKKIESEARFDGKWVLRTNTDLPAEEVALKYKQLWMVENVFRSMKSVLDTRPIWHKCDETIRGHVFCSFLAMVLIKTIQDSLDDRGYNEEWAHVIRDLDRLEEVEVEASGKKFALRSETRGAVGKLFQAAGVSLPPTVRQR